MSFCPQCKSDSFLNPNIEILLSPCYHKICTTCLDRLFPQGQGHCPECGVPLRKSNFIQSTFEDVGVERECQIRKKMSYNKKTKEDFGTLKEYYDYLEEFENTIFHILSLTQSEAKKFFQKQNYKKSDESKRKRSKLFFSEDKIQENLNNERIFKAEILKNHSFDSKNVIVPECFKVKKFGSLTDKSIMQMAINLVSNVF